jgi:hypothetical protein
MLNQTPSEQHSVAELDGSSVPGRTRVKRLFSEIWELEPGSIGSSADNPGEGGATAGLVSLAVGRAPESELSGGSRVRLTTQVQSGNYPRRAGENKEEDNESYSCGTECALHPGTPCAKPGQKQ